MKSESDAGWICVNILLYKDEASRKSGKDSIKTAIKNLHFNSPDDIKEFLCNTEISLINELYIKIKELPEFSEAVDC